MAANRVPTVPNNNDINRKKHESGAAAFLARLGSGLGLESGLGLG